jgi:imidazole glycerol-phosphate synthase subunit HisF
MRKKMFLGADHLIFQNAKELRKNMTHAETLLWGYLVQRPLGYKFRRQHPISIFIADFYSHALKLAIEVDGSIHDSNEAKEQDASRQQILEAEGIRFLRFTNEAVEKHLETVIKEIENYIIKNTKAQ